VFGSFLLQISLIILFLVYALQEKFFIVRFPLFFLLQSTSIEGDDSRLFVITYKCTLTVVKKMG